MFIWLATALRIIRRQNLALVNWVLLNDSIKSFVTEELEKKGHVIELTSGSIAEPVCLYINHNNQTIYGGAEPRLPHYIRTQQ